MTIKEKLEANSNEEMKNSYLKIEIVTEANYVAKFWPENLHDAS